MLKECLFITDTHIYTHFTTSTDTVVLVGEVEEEDEGGLHGIGRLTRLSLLTIETLDSSDHWNARVMQSMVVCGQWLERGKRNSCGQHGGILFTAPRDYSIKVWD